MRNGYSHDLKPGKRLISFFMVLFILTLGIGIGTLVSYRVGAVAPGDSQLRVQTDGKPLVGGGALALSQAFEEVANLVEPAVVNINTEAVVRRQTKRRETPEREDPMEDFFRRFFNNPNLPDAYTRQSLGSGIIVDPKGYIITNSHVVEGASKIKVGLKEGQQYTAQIIAADSLSDIAVIKIEGAREFSYAKIGDAKALKVGDWVLAIGSPFGLEQTVTAGIISATGRVFPDPTTSSMAMLFNDYLQTDAAINPGNSGGPLVNMKGEVVGINTFIQTTTRSNAGVGFAVPSHIFVNAYNQILNKGKVTRGYIGVNMNTLPFTPAMAQFFGVKQESGVLITGLSDDSGKVMDRGPAAQAGMKPEDVVVEFDGKKILSVQDLRLAVANTPPGRKVKVKVVRYGVEKELEVAVAERKLEDQEREKGTFSFEEKEEQPKPEIGLRFDTVPARLAQELNISGGAIVEEVKPGSLADEAGFASPDQGWETDIIVAANGKPINAAQDLFNLIKNLKSGETAVVKFLRVRRNPGAPSPPATYYTSIMKP
jgi:serine protease Do